MRRWWQAFFSAAVGLLLLLIPILPAYAGYASINQVAKGSDEDKTITTIMSTMKGMGYTAEAAAGVLGNINEESSFRADALQSDSVANSLNSNPCTPVGVNGAGAGLLQFDGGRRDAMACWVSKNYKTWKSGEGQIKYALDEEMKASDPFKNAAYYQNSASACPSSGADCSKLPGSAKGIDEFKKMSDAGAAAVWWAGAWERCLPCNVGNRVSIAKQVLQRYGSVNGSAPSSSSTDTVNVNGNGNKSGDEGNLPGMPSAYPTPSAELPKDATITDLSVKDSYSLAQMQSAIKNSQEGPVHAIQLLISGTGVLFMFWAVLLVMSAILDMTNNIFDFSMVNLVTLGRMEYVGDETLADGKHKTIRALCTRASVAVAIGLFLVAGTAFGFLCDVMLWIMSWNGKK